VKKLFLILLMFSFLFIFAGQSYAVATKIYGRVVLTGGTKSVDNIVYSGLVDGDLCFVVPDNKMLYIYRWEDSITNATAENSPFLIKPDDISTNDGGWELIEAFALGRSAEPGFIFRDEDCTDDDDNFHIYTDCTDTGSGTEDCDVYIKSQTAGTLITRIYINADGAVKISGLGATTPLSGTAALFDDNFTGNYLYGGTYRIITTNGVVPLPTPLEDMNFTIVNTLASTSTINPYSTTDTIHMNGLAMATDEDLTIDTVGAMCVFQYLAANTWMATCVDWAEATPP